MKTNGKVEMCGMNKGTWIRVMGVVKEDTRREARVSMLKINNGQGKDLNLNVFS